MAEQDEGAPVAVKWSETACAADLDAARMTFETTRGRFRDGPPLPW